ncbi:MAG: hypothetical protein ACLFQ3_05250 [Thiohalorhabdus sp.]
MAVTSLTAGCKLENGWAVAASQSSGEDGESGTDSPDGIWAGTLTLEGTSAGSEATAVLWNGELLVVSAEADAAYASSVARTGDDEEDSVEAEGEVRAYNADGEPLDSGTVSASVVPEEELTASVSGTSRNGDLALESAEAFENDTTLEDLADTWSVERDGRTLTLSVTRLGSVDGSRSDGCNYGGDLEAVSGAPNLFRLTLAVDLCDAEDGEYTGFAYLDSATTPDTLRLLAERDEDRFLGRALSRN